VLKVSSVEGLTNGTTAITLAGCCTSNTAICVFLQGALTWWQCGALRAARALLDWSQQVVADRSGLTLNTINNIERAAVDPRKSTWDRIVRTYLEASVVFIDEGAASLDGSDGVRLGPQAAAH